MIQFVTSYSPGRKERLKTILPELIDNGLEYVQFSWGNCTDKELFETAEWVRRITQDNDVKMIVNNRLDVALAIDSDGFHLGQNDISFDTAKKLLPKNMFIGVTVESPDDIVKYDFKPVSYFGVGPIFDTVTKTNVTKTHGLSGLKYIRGFTNKPIIAIGGITTDNFVDVMDAGANGIAVLGDIYRSGYPGETFRTLNKYYV